MTQQNTDDNIDHIKEFNITYHNIINDYENSKKKALDHINEVMKRNNIVYMCDYEDPNKKKLCDFYFNKLLKNLKYKPTKEEIEEIELLLDNKQLTENNISRIFKLKNYYVNSIVQYYKTNNMMYKKFDSDDALWFYGNENVYYYAKYRVLNIKTDNKFNFAYMRCGCDKIECKIYDHLLNHTNEYGIKFIKHQFTVPFDRKYRLDFLLLMDNNDIIVIEVDDIRHNYKDAKYRDKLKELYIKYHFNSYVIRIKDTDDYVKILSKYFRQYNKKLYGHFKTLNLFVLCLFCYILIHNHKNENYKKILKNVILSHNNFPQ